MLDMGILNVAPEPEIKPVSSMISLADIGPDPDQPRTIFVQTKIEAMAVQFADKSIGQLEAITVKHNPSGVPKFLIVSGENRYKAAVLAGWNTIRAEVVETSSFIHQVLSNEARTDMSAFDKARAYQALVDDYGYTQGGVASLLGRSNSYVSDHIQLLTLPQCIQQAAKQGKADTVGVLTALRLLVNTHKSPASIKAIQAFIDESDDAENTITTRRVSELAKTLKSGRKPAKTFKPTIEGKAFKIVGMDEDVMTIKRVGDKAPKTYRLVPVE